MEHHFTGPSFTIGIEEELMIVDAESLELVNAVESLLEDVDHGEIKPELMEPVLEIATRPCRDVVEAGAQLRALRAQVRATAAGKGLTIGSAGTHPFAMWEDARIVQRPRYRELISALRFVARQELIFGLHVHVGIDDPDAAIYVANGMRLQLPILLALSANSPFWRADRTGLMSSRTPIFRAFPRVGVPPLYADWQDYADQIDLLVRTGVIADYTYLWHDVRPHPAFGTVEVRVCDAQTRIEHTLGLAALIQAMVHELRARFDAGAPLARVPWLLIDEMKWLAARHGLAGELLDLPAIERVPARELARSLLERLAEHAQQLGSEAELEAVEDLLERGSGGERQVVVYEANHDLREVMAEIVSATGVPDVRTG
jgi:carboxylate-amine ligase